MAYLICGIPFGVVVSKIVLGKDVRKHGSGNIGATNVSRLMGKKWGILVLILDALKGFAVVYGSGFVGIESVDFANAVAAVAILGHCYPIYLKFKGGKGVATALGVLFALSPLMLGLSILVFGAALTLSHRISVGSLIAAFLLPFFAAYFQTPLQPSLAVFLTLIIWWKHSENIKRLARGQEPRFF